MISIVYFSLTGERKRKLAAPCAGQRELCLSYLLRGLLHMLMHPAALEGGDAGAALLQDLIVRHELQEGVDLLGTARQLKDHAVGRQVDDLCLVDTGDLPQLCAVGDICHHLEQEQLPLESGGLVEYEDLTGDFQTLGLKDELLQLLFGTRDGNGDAADCGVIGGRNGQAVDIEASAA